MVRIVGKLEPIEQWVVMRLDSLESGFPIITVIQVFDDEQDAYILRNMLEHRRTTNEDTTVSYTRIKGDINTGSYIVRKVGEDDPAAA